MSLCRATLQVCWSSVSIPGNPYCPTPSAGHETAWIVRANGKVDELKSTGLILGIEDDAAWTVATLPIQNGDRLLMVTDGVTETQRLDDSCFGRTRLVNLLRKERDQSITDVLKHVDRELVQFRGEMPLYDDVTLVLVEVTDCK